VAHWDSRQDTCCLKTEWNDESIFLQQHTLSQGSITQGSQDFLMNCTRECIAECYPPMVNAKPAIGPTLPFLSVPRTYKLWSPSGTRYLVQCPDKPRPQARNWVLSLREHSNLAYSVEVHVTLALSRNLVGKPGVKRMFGDVLSENVGEKHQQAAKVLGSEHNFCCLLML
jgi:hypothetical protein